MFRVRRPIVWLLGTAFVLLVGLQAVSHWLHPLERLDVRRPLFTVCDPDTAEALAEGRKISRWGRLPLGLHPGCRAFSSTREALDYLQARGKLSDGWAVYSLSGDFEQDTYQLGQQRWTTCTLRVKERVAPSWATPLAAGSWSSRFRRTGW